MLEIRGKTKLEEDDVLMEVKVFATMDHINVPPTVMTSYN
jgi:hypothetical protein